MHDPDSQRQKDIVTENTVGGGGAQATAEMTAAMPKPRLWTVWFTFVVSFAVMLIVATIAMLPFILPDILANPSAPPTSEELVAKLSTPQAILATGFPPQLAMMLVGLLAAYMSPVPLKRRLGLIDSGLNAFECLLVGIGAFIPAAFGMILAVALSYVIEPDPTAANIWENMTFAYAVPFVLFIALMPGFGEEMLYRGYIQRRLLQRWSPALAISVSSLLFALVHIAPHTVVFAFPVGLWLGYVAWKTNSIWPTIMGHILINGTWNILNVSHSLVGYSETFYFIAICALLVIGFVAFVISFRLLRRVANQRNSNCDNGIQQT